VLNGGFEIGEPHLLLPARCASMLLGDYRRDAARQEMEAAGGKVELVLATQEIEARVATREREGRSVRFKALVSEADTEILVSDAGIDALGVRIESFAPGRWRFADETTIRDSDAPQYWETQA
jgi:hypothetical protein